MNTIPHFSSSASQLDILVVLWREQEDWQSLKSCLQKQLFKNFQVYAAVQEPTEAIRQALAQDFSSWKLYEGKNSGYAGGLQRLWPHTTAPWLLCANTDVKFSEEFLTKCFEASQNVPREVGLIAPKVFYPDGKLQSAAGLLLSPEGLCRPRGMGETDQGQYDQIQESPFVSGCCFLVRKELLEDVGGFDPHFFMYVEDVDLSLRALWAGWQSRFFPNIQVIHHHGGASQRYGSLQLYYLERNHWWVSGLLPWSLRWQLPFYNFWRWLKLLGSHKKNWSLPGGSARLALKAAFWGILGIPRSWRRRSPRRLTAKEFLEKIQGHRISLNDFLKRP